MATENFLKNYRGGGEGLPTTLI